MYTTVVTWLRLMSPTAKGLQPLEGCLCICAHVLALTLEQPEAPDTGLLDTTQSCTKSICLSDYLQSHI